MLDKTVSQADIAALMADIGRRAKAAARPLAIASTDQKNAALKAMADAISARRQEILDANALDVEAALASDMAASFVDRLKLDDSRIDAITDGIRAIAALPDPVGDVIAEWDRPNGLRIERVRTPLGVIGVIYESRPNVTADAGALCLKSGNAVILRGGSDSFHSSRAIHACLTQGLESAGLPADAIQMIPVSDRAAVGELLTGLGGTVDVIVPRGGKSLVARVQADARVPVFAHLEGLCHIYVDKSADPAMARAIVVNAKMRRTGICGAAETLLLDSAMDRAVAAGILADLVDCRLRGPRRQCRDAPFCPRQRLQPRTTGAPSISMPSSPRGLSMASMAPSTISPSGRRATPRPSSPRIRRWSSASSRKWIPPSCCTTPRPSSPMAANSAWARKSALPPARCMRAGPSASSN
jgi:glutamate-5-semialdehyde dehydrogenase